MFIKQKSASGSGAALMLRVRLLLGIVALGLFVSGLTCYFLRWEIKVALDLLWRRSPDTLPFMAHEYEMFVNVEKGLELIIRENSALLLGTDWLGFAHILLAILFIGAMRDPRRNIWVIQFGMISAILVLPAALLFDTMRGMPVVHCVIDASFGVFAFIPLYAAYRMTLRLSELQS